MGEENPPSPSKSTDIELQEPPTSGGRRRNQTKTTESQKQRPGSGRLKSILRSGASNEEHLPPITIWHSFQEIVSKYGDAMAISGYQNGLYTPYTWNMYMEHVKKIASVLVHAEVKIGEGAIICAKNSLMLNIVNMAVLAAGGVVSHVRPTWTTQELVNHIVPKCNAVVLIVDEMTPNFIELLAEAKEQFHLVIVLDNVLMYKATCLNVWTRIVTFAELMEKEEQLVPLDSITVNISPSDLCLMAFDYDKEGEIQAACLSHDNVMFTASTIASSFGPLSCVDRMVSYLPLYHVAAQILELYMPIACGIPVYCAPSYKKSLLSVMKNTKPTVFFATPETWSHISIQVYKAKSESNSFFYHWAKSRAVSNSQKLQFGNDSHRSLGYMLANKLVLKSIKKKIGLENCRSCYCILSPLDLELLELFNSIDIPVYQLHGNVETSGFSTVNSSHSWVFGSYGRALNHTLLQTNSSTNEIFYRGRNVFMGLMRNRKIVPQIDLQGCWHSSQYGHLNPDGFLLITHSSENFVLLSSGDRVPVLPLKKTLEDRPEIHRAVILGNHRAFVSVLIFLELESTSSGRMTKNGPKGTLIAEEGLQISRKIGSRAVTIQEVMKCPQWAVYLDRVIEDLSKESGISGHQVRKWIVMEEEFTVKGGEIDPSTGEVRHAFVQLKYRALLDTLYN